MFNNIHKQQQPDGTIIELKETPLGRAKKRGGTWLLSELDLNLKDIHYPGKHPACMWIDRERNLYLDLMWGHVFKIEASEYRPEYVI